MKRIKSLACLSLLVPALAWAQPKTADEWYKEGETQYNLGNFEKAADAFKNGFAVEANDSKKPAYLYNVAQAYRQANRCKDAAFFYKRYLSLKDQDTVKPLSESKRAEIEQRITELEECARNQDAIARKPPDNIEGAGTGAGSGTGTPTAGTGTGTGVAAGGKQVGSGEGDGEGEGEDEGEGEGEDGGSVTGWMMAKPRVVSARFLGGAAKINAGDLDVPIQASFALAAGYPVVVQGALVVEAGAMFAFTPVPFENGMTGAKQTASLFSALAHGAASYTVAPKIGLRGELGVGVLSFGGIQEMGSPFTQNGAGTSGALAMLAVRAAASADYAITPNIVATLTPLAFSFSPAKEGMRDGIESITRLDFMLGVGYRM